MASQTLSTCAQPHIFCLCAVLMWPLAPKGGLPEPHQEHILWDLTWVEAGKELGEPLYLAVVAQKTKCTLQNLGDAWCGQGKCCVQEALTDPDLAQGMETQKTLQDEPEIGVVQEDQDPRGSAGLHLLHHTGDLLEGVLGGDCEVEFNADACLFQFPCS